MKTSCHLVHCPHKDASECSGPVGGTDTGWLAEEVHDLDPQYCRPGEPAIANHLNRHDAHDHVSRRRDASDAEVQSPRTSSKKDTYQKVTACFGVGALFSFGVGDHRNGTEPGAEQASEKHQRQEHNRQKHQRPVRRATATSRHSQARQDFSECGPTSLLRGSWNVMPVATLK